MGNRNWPPENVAVRYTVVCRGNDVYRIEGARVLESAPVPAVDASMIHNCAYLSDALDALDIELCGAWATYGEPVAGNEFATTFTAWRL